MTIIVNGERTQIQLPMKAKPEDFKAAMRGEGEKQIQEYCLEQRKRVDKVLTEMLKEDIPLTSANLKSALQNKGAGKIYTLADLFGEYLSIIEKRKGKDLSVDTYNRYVKTTKMFMDANSIKPDFPATKVNLSHLLNYQATLNSKLDVATSCNYLQKIKSIFKFGFETGRLSSNPAFGLKIDKGIKETILYLTEEELSRIENKAFSGRLQKVADIFLLSCYSGLSFADISSLEKEDFKTSPNGYIYAEKTRKKTGVKFVAIFLRNSKKILERYDYELPIITNQKTNEYLKEIGTICEISKGLHFHMARHTAASLLINHRPAIPNETIQKIMGWKDDRQLRHYAGIFNQTIFDDIGKAFGEKKPKPAIKNAEINKDIDDIEAFNKLLGITPDQGDLAD